MKKIGMLFALLAGVLLAAQAQAQMPGQTYFGIGGSAVYTDGASPYGNTQDDSNTGGAKIYFGKLYERFGMEFGYYHLGQYDVSFGGAKVGESSTQAITVSAVYATDLGAGFTFHARGGIAFTYFEIECVSLCGTGNPVLADTTQSGLSGTWALGLGARFSQNLQAKLEYEHFGNVHQAVSTTGYNDSYDLYSISLQFNF